MLLMYPLRPTFLQRGRLALSTCDRIMTVPNRESLGESSQLNGELELRQVRVMEHSPAPPLSLTKPDRTTLGLETRVLCHETGA